MKFLLYQVHRGVEERLPLSNHWHHEILKSLQERNLEKARIAMRDHLLMVKESLQRDIKSSDSQTT
jgi:DNA-binding GntR family transcriptional regulator